MQNIERLAISLNEKRAYGPLYIQLYENIRDKIVNGTLKAEERLPSLRKLSKESGLSLTTVKLAYDQLLIEGYITSKPQSGYFVCTLPEVVNSCNDQKETEAYEEGSAKQPYICDTSNFDFQKWKKCTSKVFNQYQELLFSESDIKGEYQLRQELATYLHRSRDVSCHPEQIIIGAGTQQLTSHLCRILKLEDLKTIATEDPCYLPVQNIFRDNGFLIKRIPVSDDGISIEQLPKGRPTAVYVSPSNQFPTGSLMPVARRYQLLNWAKKCGSYIIEDDYDSELRYFGKPVPPIKSLETKESVIYLGSFSSTLFPAIKISYMVLPWKLVKIFDKIKADYSQTCSKVEALTLALFMKNGYYWTSIRKLRAACGQKLQLTLDTIEKFKDLGVSCSQRQSGIAIMMSFSCQKSSQEIIELGRQLGIRATIVGLSKDQLDTKEKNIYFYYSQLPLDQIPWLIEQWITASYK